MAPVQPKGSSSSGCFATVILGIPYTFGDFGVQSGFRLYLIGILSEPREPPCTLRSASYLMLSAVRVCKSL